MSTFPIMHQASGLAPIIHMWWMSTCGGGVHILFLALIMENIGFILVHEKQLEIITSTPGLQ